MISNGISCFIDRILFIFFLRHTFYEDKSNYISELKSFHYFKDSQEAIFPLPNDAPPGIPLMTLTRVGKFNLVFFSDKIHFIVEEQFERSEFKSNIETIFSVLCGRRIADKIAGIGLGIESSFKGLDSQQKNRISSSLITPEYKFIYSKENHSSTSIQKIEPEIINIKNLEVHLNTTTIIQSEKFINAGDKRVVFSYDANTLIQEIPPIDLDFIHPFIDYIYGRTENLHSEFINSFEKLLGEKNSRGF